MTTVTRRGKTSLHQLRKLWREQLTPTDVNGACIERDPAQVAREDEEIAAKRAAFPLH